MEERESAAKVIGAHCFARRSMTNVVAMFRFVVNVRLPAVRD